MTKAQVTGIHVYPVKSMRGISLDRGILTPQGLRHDRCWMVVRENGRFVTQREDPRMALIHTKLDEQGVTLSLDGFGSISLPDEATDGETIQTRVWGEDCETIEQGAEISRWLTSALESSDCLKMVRLTPGFVRPQSRPEILGENTSTRFADAAPFLVANEASLRVLNEELEARGHSPVPMNRFRPNIVLRGPGPFEEHVIEAVSTKNYGFKLCYPCQRCIVTTIDQVTAMKNPDWQPYNTLREINPMPDNKRAPAFAENAILTSGDGQALALGDRLSILQ